MDNSKVKDIKEQVAGFDFFADSESFLNELTDSDLDQIRGGVGANGNANAKANGVGANGNANANMDIASNISLLLCT